MCTQAPRLKYNHGSLNIRKTQHILMKKIILGLVAAAAVAAPLALSAGSASAATTDANGVVTVSKGEIMAQFPGMNEARLPEDRHGRRRVAHRLQRVHRHHDHRGGLLRRHTSSTTSAAPSSPARSTLTEIYNGSADKVTGWNLGAKGASVITEDNTYGTSPSGRFPNYATICAGSRLRDELRSRASCRATAT